MTLIEIVAVVVIIGAIVGGVAGLYVSATRTQVQTQVISDLIGLRKVVQNYYLANGTYTNLAEPGNRELTTYFATSGSLPTQMVWTGTELLSAENIRVQVFNNNVAAGNVRFQISRVPRTICIHLLTTPLNWTGVRIGATGAALNPVLRTPAQAQGDCPAGNDILINFVSR